ncbi:MAG TPA: hypothetical protein V6C69_22055 [Trichormus sp.]
MATGFECAAGTIAAAAGLSLGVGLALEHISYGPVAANLGGREAWPGGFIAPAS